MRHEPPMGAGLAQGGPPVIAWNWGRDWYYSLHRYRNPGDPQGRGEQKAPGTSHVLSHGDDFSKRIETGSEWVALA
jgi:hypothetical protein